MINGLDEYEKYKVIRPILRDWEYDKYEMPIIKKIGIDEINWDNIDALGYQNLSKNKNNANNLILMFNYDNVLLPLWNSPLKKIALFKTCAAIATPDFSIYPSMNYNEIRHNIYMNRWLGCTWQSYGCTVFPTVGWAKSDTYDICFSGLEYGSIPIISTLGCQKNTDDFLAGFNEMKARINPPLIVVYGDMINGMTGTFCNFRYNEAFNQEFKQLKLEPIFTIKEVA